MRLLTHLRQFVPKFHCFDVVKFRGAVSNRQGEHYSQRILDLRRLILECGGKRSATALVFLWEWSNPKRRQCSAAGAVQQHCPYLSRFVIVTSKTPINSALKYREA